MVELKPHKPSHEELNNIIRRHSDWVSKSIDEVENHGRIDGRTDGEKAHFINTDLSNFNLSGVDLRGAHFSQVTFNNTNLAGAKLDGAWLHSCTLTNSNLTEADFNDGKAESTTFTQCDLSRIGLERTELPRCVFTETNLTGANLVNANINSTKLLNCDLTNASLVGSWMNDLTSFDGSILQGVNFCRAGGNNNQVKTAQCVMLCFSYTADSMFLENHRHTLEQWWSLTDDEIQRMTKGVFDGFTLGWWRDWKPVLKRMIELSPAEPAIRPK